MKIVKTIAAFNQIIIMDSNGNSDPLALVAFYIVLSFISVIILIVRYLCLKDKLEHNYDNVWYKNFFLDRDTGYVNDPTLILFILNTLAFIVYFTLIIYELLS